MDIERPHVQRRRWIKRLVTLTIVGVAVGGVTLGLGRLQPAAPTVDRQMVLTGEVKRGTFVREVRGIGTLAPEEEIWVTANTDGQIETMPVKPGIVVQPDTVLIGLRNRNMDLELLQARLALKSAQVELQSRNTDSDNQVLSMQADIAELEDQYKVTQLQSSGDKELSDKGFLPPIKLDLTEVQLNSIKRKIELKKQNLERFEASKDDRLAVAKGQVEQAQALLDYKLEQAKLLQVRAGVSGVLMEFSGSVGLGKRVGTGTVLAKVVDPTRLKAELKISEQQARDLSVGLPAHLEILNQTVEGRVTRINPAVVGGNVAVDVELLAAAPQGARPDLSITGVVEIERVDDLVYMDRPVFAAGDSVGTIFKLDEATGEALRVPVVYGRTSATTVEVVKGLAPGDKVVISDMSRWDDVDRLILK